MSFDTRLRLSQAQRLRSLARQKQPGIEDGDILQLANFLYRPDPREACGGFRSLEGLPVNVSGEMIRRFERGLTAGERGVLEGGTI